MNECLPGDIVLFCDMVWVIVAVVPNTKLMYRPQHLRPSNVHDSHYELMDDCMGWRSWRR